MSHSKKRKQPSGGAKLRASGKKAVLLGVLPAELAKIRAAAEIEMRPVTQFVAYYALRAAGYSVRVLLRLARCRGRDSQAFGGAI